MTRPPSVAFFRRQTFHRSLLLSCVLALLLLTSLATVGVPWPGRKGKQGTTAELSKANAAVLHEYMKSPVKPLAAPAPQTVGTNSKAPR